MIILGFGGFSEELSLEEEQYRAEQMALKMHAILEEHGWQSALGRDPVLILIEAEEGEEFTQNGDDS